MHSSPGEVWHLMAIWLVMVPEGQKRAASLPNMAAPTWKVVALALNLVGSITLTLRPLTSCKRLTVGSSPHTSSPTGADIMA